MSEPFLGEIRMFAGNFAPRGWANCDGQLLEISRNSALFSLLGTIYGGDGRTTFAVPDLRGRSAIHAGSGTGLDPVSQGQRGGSTSFQLTAAEIPSHDHTVAIGASDETASEIEPGPSVALAAGGEPMYAPSSAQNTTIAGGTTSSTGGNQPVSHRSPYCTVRYIIALQGIFPSRS